MSTSMATQATATLLPAALLAAALALPVGCQSSRNVTWDEAVETPRHLVAAPRAEDARAQQRASAGIIADQSSGVLIDRALVQLNAERARAQGLPDGSARQLEAYRQAWSAAVAAIDEALAIAPVSSDLGAFIRARITLEVELQLDQERGRPLPEALPQRVARTLAGVDESVMELRAANAPGTIQPSPRLGDGELVLRAPLAPLIVSSPFGRRRDPFTQAVRYHAGVDLDAPEGTPVHAAATGIVVYAGPQGGYGRYIVLDHGEGVRTHYAHLSKINARLGNLILEGDVIGLVGATGRATGPHLHFAVTDALGAFLDPVAVLDVPFSTHATQVASRP